MLGAASRMCKLTRNLPLIYPSAIPNLPKVSLIWRRIVYPNLPQATHNLPRIDPRRLVVITGKRNGFSEFFDGWSAYQLRGVYMHS